MGTDEVEALDERSECITHGELTINPAISLYFGPGYTTESFGRRYRDLDYSTRFLTVDYYDGAFSLGPEDALRLCEKLAELRPMIERWLATRRP